MSEDNVESFCELLCGYPWFEPEDRPKTFLALAEFHKRVPLRARRKVLGKCPWIFAPRPDDRGHVFEVFTPAGLPKERREAFVYLAPQLEKLPQWRVNNVVAHELAHVVLGHERVEAKKQVKKTLALRDDPREIAADRLIVRWGYRPAYRRPRGWK